MTKWIRKSMWIAFILLLLLGVGITVGCVRQSGGVWYFREAKQPVGCPELTPVGEIQVKQYPAYREAVVDETTGTTQNSMFRELFKHIKQREISMTAPVDMTYDATGGKPVMRSMAFLYDVPDRGPVNEDGKVTVRDIGAQKVISTGVRGSYNDEHFEAAVRQLIRWLDDQQEYEADGPPRYLGYNSPFVPFFWRYGEVQIPIRSTAN